MQNSSRLLWPLPKSENERDGFQLPPAVPTILNNLWSNIKRFLEINFSRAFRVEVTTGMQHNGRVALPFYYLSLRAHRPRNPAYPKLLATLGDHIRKRRMDLGLQQKDVGRIVNATTSTVTNREKGRTYPKLKFLPKVHEFLGYIPFESEATSIAAQIRELRHCNGLSMKRLAKILDVDPGTIARWENGGRVIFRVCLNKLKRIGVNNSQQ